jgi:hypothetical protein
MDLGNGGFGLRIIDEASGRCIRVGDGEGERRKAFSEGAA